MCLAEAQKDYERPLECGGELAGQPFDPEAANQIRLVRLGVDRLLAEEVMYRTVCEDFSP